MSLQCSFQEQLYEREGIEWDPLDFPDNQDAVDMLQGKALKIVHECSLLPSSNALVGSSD